MARIHDFYAALPASSQEKFVAHLEAQGNSQAFYKGLPPDQRQQFQTQRSNVHRHPAVRASGTVMAHPALQRPDTSGAPAGTTSAAGMKAPPMNVSGATTQNRMPGSGPMNGPNGQSGPVRNMPQVAGESGDTGRPQFKPRRR